MNIALIGMPTSGKSTVGVVLAKMLGFSFVDTDILIQNRENKKLKDIIDIEGIEGLLRIESEVIQNLNVDNYVIATGGSAVYSAEAMAHLKEISKVVYLEVDLIDLTRRMTDMRQRGVVFREGQTLEGLFNERKSLYEKYADYTISEKDKSLECTVTDILNLFN